MNILNALIYPAAALLLVGLGYAFGLDSADKRLAKVRAIAARRKLRLRAQREEIRWYQRHWAPDTDDERPETPYEPRRHKTDTDPEIVTPQERFRTDGYVAAAADVMRTERVRLNADAALAAGADRDIFAAVYGGHTPDADLPLFQEVTDALTGLTAAYQVLCETERPGGGGGEDTQPVPKVAAAIAMRQIAHAPKVGV